MSLFRRKRGGFWWYDFTIEGERYRGSTKLRDKAAAARAEERERQRAVLGSSHRQDPTIERSADLWFTAKIAGKKSEKTVAQRLEIMLRLIGPDTKVSRIDSPEIAEAIAARRLEPIIRGKKATNRLPTNSTVNRDLIDTTLRPILHYAKTILKARVADIAWKDLKLAEPKERDRPFTTAEKAAWRDALPEHHRPIFDFIDRYAVRLTEAFFPPANFDPETGYVFLRQRKAGKPHAIRVLPQDLPDLAARYGRALAAESPTLWLRETKKGPRPIKPRSFQSASRVALDRAGILDARPVHDLRHSAATHLMRKTGIIYLTPR